MSALLNHGGALAIGILNRVKRVIASTASEAGRETLDQPSLRQAVVKGVMVLRQRGQRGVDALPRAVQVRIRIGQGSEAVVRRIVDDPQFDADVEADLLNRLVGARAEALPVRNYDIQTDELTSVTVVESSNDAIAWLQIEGGDREGERYPFEATEGCYLLGRGPWHGRDKLLANQMVVSDNDRFVSRRAALLRRAGSGLEIESRDQGDSLVVVRENGRRIRPTHVRERRVSLRPGDAIEFSDGGSQVVRMRLHARQPADPAGEKQVQE